MSKLVNCTHFQKANVGHFAYSWYFFRLGITKMLKLKMYQFFFFFFDQHNFIEYTYCADKSE